MAAKRGNPNAIHRDQRHPNARFSDATVRRIRRRYDAGELLSVIAGQLDCHYDTLRRIVRHESYAGVL